MKMITDKQKKFINDLKGVITENGINAIDAFYKYEITKWL